jgi:hypothetical protein
MRVTVAFLLSVLAGAASLPAQSSVSSSSASDSTDVKVTARATYEIAPGVHSMFERGSGYHGMGADYVTVARKGQRFAIAWRPGADAAPGPPVLGDVVDLGAQMLYRINFQQREYVPRTLADVRHDLLGFHSAGEQIRNLSPQFQETPGPPLPEESRNRAKRFQYTTEVRVTGQHRTIAGLEAREVVINLRAWERNKPFEKAGGWVVTHTAWLAPPTPAIDALVAVQREYVRTLAKGAFDAVFTPVELPDAERIDPEFPELAVVAARLFAEVATLDGTIVSSRTTYDMARNAGEMRDAVLQKEGQLRAANVPVPKDLAGTIPGTIRIATLGLEYLTIDHAVTDAEVTIPEWFTLYRKK